MNTTTHTPSFGPLLTPEFVSRSLQLKVPSLPKSSTPFTQIITDSRQIKEGCLFVALKGDKYDGHEFIENAIAQGARGILCRRGTPISSYKDLCVFMVEDTLHAFRRLAAAWRKEFTIPIVVVAGSVGKTTTKELLAALLLGKWPQIVKTKGSQNGFIGIPATLLELRPEHEAAVIEVGIDEIGSMQQHLNIIGANHAVLTAIGPEHLSQLHDIPTIAREEGLALSHVARARGVVAINLDDPWIRPHLTTLRDGRRIPYSMQGASAPIDMMTGLLSPDGLELTFQGLGIAPTTVPVPLLGVHNATNLLGAIAIAAGLGLTGAEIQTGLQTFKGAEGRSEIRKLPGGFLVLCDYYNAQPPAVEAGLELAAQIYSRAALQQNSSGKKAKCWVCLGDMLQLGPDEESLHRGLANKILELGLDHILLHGAGMAKLFDELEKRGFRGNRAHYDSKSEMASALTQGIQPGDTIFIKGSRGMKMEEVWQTLEVYCKSHWNDNAEGNRGKSSNPPPHT